MTTPPISLHRQSSMIFQINGEYQAAVSDLCVVLDKHHESCQDSSIYHWGETAVNAFVIRNAWNNKIEDEIEHTQYVNASIQDLVKKIFLSQKREGMELTDLDESVLYSSNLKVFQGNELHLAKEMLEWLQKWTLQIQMEKTSDSSFERAPIFKKDDRVSFAPQRLLEQEQLTSLLLQQELEMAARELDDFDQHMNEMDLHLLKSMQETMHKARLAEEQMRQNILDAQTKHQSQVAELEIQHDTKKQFQKKEMDALVLHLSSEREEHHIQTNLAQQMIKEDLTATQAFSEAHAKQKNDSCHQNSACVEQMAKDLEQARKTRQKELDALEKEKNKLQKQEKALKSMQDQLTASSQNLTKTLADNQAQKDQIRTLSR